MNRARIAGTLLLALALAGCSGSAPPEGQGAQPAALVSLATAGAGDVAETITLYGEVERAGQLALVAPVEAVVGRIEAPAGSAVAAGQVVARLGASPATRAQLRAAAADAEAAQQALGRAGRLRTDGLASDAEVEAARSRSAAASALLASLGQRSAALVLRAPHAGFVDSIGAATGDLVQPGTVVASLSRRDGAIARFGVNSGQARRLSVGAPIEIHPGDGFSPFTVRIHSISPVVNAQTRLASIIAEIPPGRGVAAGQPLSASVALRASAGAVVIPYSALLDDGGQPFLFVVKEGAAHRRDVETGATDGRVVAIVRGLAAGETVVSIGGTGVADGMKVRHR